MEQANRPCGSFAVQCSTKAVLNQKEKRHTSERAEIVQQSKQPVEIDGDALFEEMAIPESEEAFAGHSCLSWAAPNSMDVLTPTSGGS
ncbi:azolemycin family RiPP peptide [Streptomyces alboniger]|uniref:Azolemycin family RiPP peptide n=1 Tax=Streptomyces alboniger TaxID=132473 RepID=A0A5J6HUB7_STRAD|nr:azolemycin family RiPP peptide [Streptomyces alboniger]QEV21901.1 azolemycin family RiPP peptide [Streptomyces alboniger]